MTDFSLEIKEAEQTLRGLYVGLYVFDVADHLAKALLQAVAERDELQDKLDGTCNATSVGSLAWLSEQRAKGMDRLKAERDELAAKLAEVEALLAFKGIAVSRCRVIIKGEQCGLKAGHEGKHLWLNGD